MTDEGAPAEPQPSRAAVWFRRLAPWLSLATGITGAIIMDRRPERAWIAGVAAGAGWVALLAAALFLRRDPEQLEGRARAALRALAFGSFALTQSALQLTLFFVIPWYASAALPIPGHVVFVATLGMAALLTLWDPLLRRLIAQPAFAVPFKALTSFAGLCAVLPIFGVPNRVAVWAAAGATALAAPLLTAVVTDKGQRARNTGLAALVAACLLGALALGAIRIIPAAPLRVVTMAIGRDLQAKRAIRKVEHLERRPAKLVCASAIWAPLGLREQLLHVWTHDGVQTDAIPLDIEGGRAGGFRTWSIKRNFGREPAGVWRCSVETSAGQVLGFREVVIDG